MRRFFVRARTYLSPLFTIAVLIPTCAAVLYYGFFASDVFVSVSSFVVRSPDKPSTTGFGVLLKSAGFSSSDDAVFAAQTYIESRDALRAIDREGKFRAAYGRTDISVFDRFNGTGLLGSFEDLYRYFRGKIDVKYDSVGGITKLGVRAFAPRDAYRFNEQLLQLAEQTVNRLNERGRRDLIGFAQTEVDNAKYRSRAAASALASFRDRTGVVDPEKQAAVQLQMISKLQDELIANRTQLAELRRYAPANPQVESLNTRIGSLQRQINQETGKVAGNQRSLAGTAAQYQRLVLESQFADKELAVAMSSLSEAQNEARRKQAYVERIVQPNLPDYPAEPRRLRGILATFILGLVAWGIGSMLLAGIREHRD
jgi:BexC/CtrB/KpsE family polysaccharide export inner-membrane protein